MHGRQPFSQRALSIQDMDFNRCAVQSVYAAASRYTEHDWTCNHAVALGNFMEGRVWIEDENGQATTVLKTKNGQKLLHGIQLRSMLRKYHVGSCSIYASSVQACCCLPHQQAYGTWLSSSCLTASIATVSTQASPSFSEPTIPECRLTSLLVGFTRNRDNPSHSNTELC